MRLLRRKGLLRMMRMGRGRLGVRGWIGVIVSIVLVVIELAFLIPAYLVVAYAIIVMKPQYRHYRQVCQEVIIPSYFSGYVRDVYFGGDAGYAHSGQSIYRVLLEIDLRDRSEHLAKKDRYVTFRLNVDCAKDLPLLTFLDRGDSIVKYPNGLKVRVIKRDGKIQTFILPVLECSSLRDEME
jgi:hypothetical protein